MIQASIFNKANAIQSPGLARVLKDEENRGL